MKKLLVAAILLGGISISHADDVISTTGEGMGTELHIGKLSLNIPFNELDATYLYDFVSERNLVGGETPIAKLWNLQGTIGAVTSLEGKGSPFVGGKIVLPNPAPNLAFLGQIQPGIFGGYDWNRGSAIAGIKADLPIFQ